MNGKTLVALGLILLGSPVFAQEVSVNPALESYDNNTTVESYDVANDTSVPVEEQQQTLNDAYGLDGNDALTVTNLQNAELAALGAAAGPCFEATAARREVCEIVNRERKGRRLATISLNSQLSSVAQKFAEDMYRRGYFSHVTPEGGTMQRRLKGGQVDYGWAGENIARGQKDSVEAMRSWMNSSGHRANILHNRYRKLGVGHAGNVWVQVFTD